MMSKENEIISFSVKRVIIQFLLENECSQNNSHKRDQAIKSTGRMPWHQEPMKDVTSCDKLR